VDPQAYGDDHGGGDREGRDADSEIFPDACSTFVRSFVAHSFGRNGHAGT
jgi:hypothetical protein